MGYWIEPPADWRFEAEQERLEDLFQMGRRDARLDIDTKGLSYALHQMGLEGPEDAYAEGYAQVVLREQRLLRKEAV